ncbi:tautomerase [Roseobacter sp. HKCCD9010]|uniref:nuclear transport factor 2 family protein n=1 Tax=unclassified Roseobacter TaxID=196798 RepID=UPI001492F3B8|nr:MULTISPECIES: tautomerase family protein [unclassified Roseobacter]MBF9052080.1 tautomerase [Rhodobacterales bacterium HKCCD4356]NNV14002.1 tautomerase [Roseobacter sp. HKCCD7357]NNV18243.1 tautomerase [Roseobacter sp. HKCCD8768]NNV27701.1 tautomerase [Roseobacter sp. HKCCD8192]NNV31944.1 tautomerase [Roseobacter sp. HKCCD9061]
MPIVEVHVREGYSAENKSRLAAALEDTVRSVVCLDDAAVTVVVQEAPPECYARVKPSHSPALHDPLQIALDFLAAMEARDIKTAEAMLAAGFRMTFPGTQPMASIAELIGWAKGRYQFVRKTITSTEAFHQNGRAIVYVTGTLSGAWPDGEPFEGIRFIDRFEIKGAKLICQDVWNDIAEERQQ